MTSVRIKFRPSSVEGNDGTLYYQIIHERNVRQVSTDYRLLPSEWNASRACVIVSGDDERKRFLASVRDKIRWDMERLSRIIRRLEASCIPFSAQDIADEFRRYADEFSLFNYIERQVARLKGNGRIRCAETYRMALVSFRKFRDGEDIMLDAITADVMEDYEAWLSSKGAVPNTTSFYARILRAVYNRAVDDGIIEGCNPFRRVYTGVGKTVKRALPLSDIRRIRHLDLSLYPTLDYARDIFILSFFLRGMSFVDMSFLRKSDLSGGVVSYRRRKTGQLLHIAWTPEMQQILDKYPENETDYLLPIIRSKGLNEMCAYRYRAARVNRSLGKIAGMLQLKTPLTMYVARHSWASVARGKGVPLSVISEGLGHDSESTTRIYLSELESSVVDKANSLIIKSL